MKATDILDTRHREAPLGPSGDRLAALFSGLAPLPNPKLERLRLSGALIAGEVTDATVNGHTFPFTDRSQGIFINSGLIDFYEYVAKVLFSATNVYHDAALTEAALSINSVVARLKLLFEAWTPEGLAQDRIAPILQMQLAQDAAECATMLAAKSLTFVLLHEFGHAEYYKPPRGKNPPARLTPQQETEADIVGVRNLFVAAAPEGRGPVRMSFAGAFVALRVLAVLADMGHVFGDSHPPPLERIKTVVRAIRGICTERDYWSLTTIAYSFDEQLAVAGAMALGKDQPCTFEYACSRMVSILETIVKGRKPASELLLGMRRDFEKLPPDALTLLAAAVSLLFPHVAQKTSDENQDRLWAAMDTQLRNSVAGFPEPARTAFQSALA